MGCEFRALRFLKDEGVQAIPAPLVADAPRRIVLHFLRDLDRETMVEAFTARGLPHVHVALPVVGEDRLLALEHELLRAQVARAAAGLRRLGVR